MVILDKSGYPLGLGCLACTMWGPWLSPIHLGNRSLATAAPAPVCCVPSIYLSSPGAKRWQYLAGIFPCLSCFAYLDVFLAFGQSPRMVLKETSVKTASLPEASLFGFGLLNLAWVELGTAQHRSMAFCLRCEHCLRAAGWTDKGRQRYARLFTHLQWPRVGFQEGEEMTAGLGGRDDWLGETWQVGGPW